MTLWKISAVLTLLASFVAHSHTARASDLPYGADSIPFLMRHSSVILRVATAEPAGDEKAARLFIIRPAEVLRGAVSSQYIIAFPSETGVPNVIIPPGSLVFLARLLNDAEKEEWGIKEGGAVFAVTAASRGVLSPENGVAEATRDYPALDAVEAHANWTRKQLTSNNPYLQRSAVLEIAGVGGTWFSPATTTALLRKVVTSDAIATAVRRSALQEFVSNAPPEASNTLRDLALSLATPDTLRLDAVIALPRVEGGVEVLRELFNNEEFFIEGAARERVRVLDSIQDKFQTPSPQRLQSDEVDSSVRDLLEGSQSLAKKLALLQRISTSQPQVAASAFKKVILTTQNSSIRYAAFGKLYTLSEPRRKEVLEELRISLRDKDLRLLVEDHLKTMGGVK